jgi:8-hydroxy-5-deazaflavin:NADPH oxidoreductase
MRIGVIGSGNIGATVAGLLVGAGNEVAIANSRGPESLAELVADLGERAGAATIGQAAAFGDVVLVAIPFGRYRELPAPTLEGTIVIDATNYYPERDGGFAELDSGAVTSSELVAAHLGGSRLVKAFNTMYYGRLAREGRPDAPVDERLAIFLAGDDDAAKELVAGLIDEIGFAPVDTGTLSEGGRLQQPGSDVYNVPLTGAEGHAAIDHG